MAGDTGREIIFVEGIIDAISPSQVPSLASESIIITVCALEMGSDSKRGHFIFRNLASSNAA